MIEIKELLVRAVIVENANTSSKAQSTSSQNAVKLSDEEKSILMEDCIRQVLAILERQKER